MENIPQERKKILFLITKSNWGGAQRYVYDITTHLDQTRFEPVVALGGSGILKEQLTHANIRTHQLAALENRPSLKVFWWSCRELYTLLRSEQPAILHVNSSVAGVIGVLTGRLARVPRIIFTAHGWAFNEDRPWWQKFIIKLFHWLTVLCSHKTIAVSNAIITQMNWPFAEHKMKLVHLGRTIGPMYEKREARAKIEDFCPRLTHHSQATWLGCVAELHPIKRHQVLITSFKTLLHTHPDLRLILIGTGQIMSELQQRIIDERLESHVFLVGAVSEAARFFKAFDLLVLASKSESYGYVLHEAGLASVPVVATAVGGILDVVEHKKTGLLVPPDDAPALTNALEQSVTNATDAHTMAAEHHKKMTERSVTTMVDATSTIYSLPL